jgi:RES domain-containing protein
MIHDAELVDRLADFPTESFQGRVFRATRQRLDPLAASGYGGRWSPVGGPSALYTSFLREGALAEVSFHWGQQTPRPTKPAAVHALEVSAPRALRLVRASLEQLGVDMAEYQAHNLPRTQSIGAAVEFLGYDGLIAPCARWACDNLILFPESMSFGGSLECVEREEVDWLVWAREHGLLED